MTQGHGSIESSLLQRWTEGGHTAPVRWREPQAKGVTYSLTNVQRFVADLRRAGPPVAGRPRTALTNPHCPPPRHAAGLVLRRPEQRTDEQRASLNRLRAEHATIATATDLVEDVLVMLRRREEDWFSPWLDAAETSAVEDLTRFAAKLRTDHDAVQAGLTLRHSKGQTDGHVNQLKPIKRQDYGHASVDLLRRRVRTRN